MRGLGNSTVEKPSSKVQWAGKVGSDPNGALTFTTSKWCCR